MALLTSWADFLPDAQGLTPDTSGAPGGGR